MKFAFSCALCLVLPFSVMGTAAKAEMFPALRKKKALAAAQVQTSIAKTKAPTEETPEVPQEAPKEIPLPMDAGADGYPQLPAVSQMLSEASGTLKAVNSRASKLEARVVQAQMQSESKMAKQKAAFEEKLKQQEDSNHAVIVANANITAEIKSLQGSNAALKKHAHEVEETNKVMRSELRTLESRLGVAKDFTAKSLTSTDDSKNSLLQVLKGGKKFGHRKHALVETASSTKREVDDTDDDDSSHDADDTEDKDSKDDDEDEEANSFLALSSKVRRSSDSASTFEAAMSDLENAVPAGPAMGGDSAAGVPSESPADLLSVLSKDVAHLAQQEKESEKNLKNLFIRDFRAGAKRHQALLAQQKTLVGTRGNLQSVEAKLKSAVAHLESTKTQLDGRLHGLGQFLQKLAHLSMAPQKEVPHLLEALPKVVVLKPVV